MLVCSSLFGLCLPVFMQSALAEPGTPVDDIHPASPSIEYASLPSFTGFGYVRLCRIRTINSHPKSKPTAPRSSSIVYQCPEGIAISGLWALCMDYDGTWSLWNSRRNSAISGLWALCMDSDDTSSLWN